MGASLPDILGGFFLGLTVGLSLSTMAAVYLEITPRWDRVIRAWRSPRPQVGDTWIHDRLGRVMLIPGESADWMGNPAWTAQSVTDGSLYAITGYGLRWDARRVSVTLQDVPPPDSDAEDPQTGPVVLPVAGPSGRALHLEHMHGPLVPTMDRPALQTRWRGEYRYRAVYFDDSGRVHRYSQAGIAWYTADGMLVTGREAECLKAACIRSEIEEWA